MKIEIFESTSPDSGFTSKTTSIEGTIFEVLSLIDDKARDIAMTPCLRADRGKTLVDFYAEEEK